MGKTALFFEAALARKALVMLTLPGDLSMFFGKMAKKGFKHSEIPQTQKWINVRYRFQATKDKAYGRSVYCFLEPVSLLAFENAARGALGVGSRLFVSFADHYIPFGDFKMRSQSLEQVEVGLAENDPKIVLYQHGDYRIGMPRLRKDDMRRSVPFIPYIQEEQGSVEWLPITEILGEEQVAPSVDSTGRFEPQRVAF